jgi:hypothetical protein
MSIKESGKNIVLSNENLSVTIDKKNGFVSDVVNKQTGIRHKKADSGAWPFGMDVTNTKTGQKLVVEITKDSEQTIEYLAENTKLVVTYPNLVSGTEKTNIKIVVEYQLAESAEHFELVAEIDNRKSKYTVDKFWLCKGGELSADTEKENEHLALPQWVEGCIFHNPYGFESLKTVQRFGYPANSGINNLQFGWADMYGKKSGIGIAYLDNRGLGIEFAIGRDKSGMTVYPVFFEYHNFNRIVPLKPGDKFKTGTLIVAVHKGDWHQMADIYRAKYQELFKNDYLTWDKISKLAKNVDVNLHYPVLGAHCVTSASSFYYTFNEITDKIRDVIKKCGINPGNILVWVYGHSREGHDRMNPGYFPANERAGGTEGCYKMVKDLHDMGIKTVILYTHPWAIDPRCAFFDPKYCTGDWFDMMGVRYHQVVCLDTNEAKQMWKQHVISHLVEGKVDGIQFDQASLQWTVCLNKKHQHSKSTEKTLTSFVRSMVDLTKLVKSSLKPNVDEPVILSEGGNDLLCRHMDFWVSSFPEIGLLTHGAESYPEICMYTFPQYVRGWNHVRAEDINRALVLGGFVHYVDGNEEHRFYAQYLKIRTELRHNKAPGFPYGFRDIMGITVDNKNLVAKVFKGDDGLTLVYYAKEDLEGTIKINGKYFGFNKKIEPVKVSLKRDEAGYKIIKL